MINSKPKYVILDLRWQDQDGATNIVGFKNVQDLAKFLKKHPELAEALKYIPKKK